MGVSVRDSARAVRAGLQVARGVAAGVAGGENRAFESSALTCYLRPKTAPSSLVPVVEMRMPPSSQHQHEVEVARAQVED